MDNGATISTVEGRSWLPEPFLDEVVPESRPTPNDWLFRLDDGAYRCGARDDASCGSFAIVEGEIVCFCARDDHPDSVLAIRGIDDWSFDPKPPVGAVLYLPWDYLAEGPDDLVEQMKANGEFDPGSTETVRVYTWGDPVRLRFTAKDGPPRFVLDAAIQGGPSA